jgi:CheY-like chemotaxis protein
MDGVEAAAQIRDRCDVPVVYLTAHADSPVLQRPSSLCRSAISSSRSGAGSCRPT